MTQKPITAISPRTNYEWPPDHPIRAVARTMTNREIELTGTHLICTIVGELRLPPAEDDHDVEAQCAMCPNRVMHRASAAKNLKPICWRCWQKLDRGAAT